MLATSPGVGWQSLPRECRGSDSPVVALIPPVVCSFSVLFSRIWNNFSFDVFDVSRFCASSY
jgi:hypothetical protein